MRKLLLLLMAVLASVGVNAANFTWTSDDGQYTVTATNVNKSGSDTYQKLEVNKEGALAAFVEATKDLSDPDGGPLKGVGGNSQRVNLIVEGPMGADDCTAMNSSTVSRWGTFTSVDLSGATIADFDQLAGMSMSGMKYLQLPGNLKSTESMATLKAKNAALDIVISGDKTTNPAVPEVTVYSFTANSIGGAITAFRENYGDFTNLQNAKKITMTGEYGDKDLQDNGKVFKKDPAIWDFTGAHFADCTIAAPGISYKNYDDPYEEHENASPSNSSNAFYYFGGYATTVVDIKLPDKNMTLLPTQCLTSLGESNKANYQLIYGTSDSEFNEAFGEEKTVKKYYESGTDTEFTGDKYQDNGAWKGRQENPCVVDLNTPPTESQVYTVNGQTYPVGDLTVTNGQVTPTVDESRRDFSGGQFGHGLVTLSFTADAAPDNTPDREATLYIKGRGVQTTTPIVVSQKGTWVDAISETNIQAGDKPDEAIYNLNGQRINKPAKGIYIKGRKKLIIR